tara:strand:- start:10053 stop:10466 length:414 start_codon:yes stop_codon:yes gene_type:complete
MLVGALLSALSGGKVTASGMMGGIQNDIYNTINFKNLPAKTAERHMTKTKATMKRNAKEAAYYGGNDKPRQAARPVGPPPPPPKTAEQFYAELSNKANWGPLPSLGMTSSGKKNKPSYKDVELREGGEVRSLFQPYG